jgi:hypothetical protein
MGQSDKDRVAWTKAMGLVTDGQLVSDKIALHGGRAVSVAGQKWE